jgi:hypothetical protein
MIIFNFIISTCLILTLFSSGIKILKKIDCNSREYTRKINSKLNKTVKNKLITIPTFCHSNVSIKGNFKGHVTNE